MIKKSKLIGIINREIKEALSNPPTHTFDKSDRKIIDSNNKIDLLKNEFVVIDREIKKIEKYLKTGEGDAEQLNMILSKNKRIKNEIELQINKIK